MTGGDDATRDSRAKVFVVMAAFNEGAIVREVVENVRARFEHVVVVDDGSSDDTGKKALGAGATVLTHLLNRGQGAALQTGIDHACQSGADVVVTFDADGQHDVDDIDALVAPILDGRCDVVLGSRFLRGDNKVPTVRRIVLKLGILFTRVVSGIKLTDAHNGLRAFSRDAAARIRIVQDRMSHASEIIDEISTLGLRHEEVPVRIAYTAYSMKKGQSSGAAFQVVMDFIVGKWGK